MRRLRRRPLLRLAGGAGEGLPLPGGAGEELAPRAQTPNREAVCNSSFAFFSHISEGWVRLFAEPATPPVRLAAALVITTERFWVLGIVGRTSGPLPALQAGGVEREGGQRGGSSSDANDWWEGRIGTQQGQAAAGSSSRIGRTAGFGDAIKTRNGGGDGAARRVVRRWHRRQKKTTQRRTSCKSRCGAQPTCSCSYHQDAATLLRGGGEGKKVFLVEQQHQLGAAGGAAAPASSLRQRSLIILSRFFVFPSF